MINVHKYEIKTTCDTHLKNSKWQGHTVIKPQLSSICHLAARRPKDQMSKMRKLFFYLEAAKWLRKKHISNICQFQALRINNNDRTLIDLGAPALYYKGGNMEVTKSYPMERKIAVKLSCYT